MKRGKNDDNDVRQASAMSEEDTWSTGWTVKAHERDHDKIHETWQVARAKVRSLLNVDSW